PEINGKTFTGWNSKEDGSGSEYEAGEMLVVPEEDITLYAQYETETFQVDYQLNEGTFISDDIVQEFTVDDEIKLPTAEDIVKDGYTFAGWFTEEDLSGNSIEVIEEGTTENITLYAKWEEKVNEDKVSGENVKALIDALPSIENVSVDDKEQMEAARTAYEELSDQAKDYVDNITKLETLEEKVAQLEEAAELENKVEELKTNVSEALETEVRKVTNDSAEELGT